MESAVCTPVSYTHLFVVEVELTDVVTTIIPEIKKNPKDLPELEDCVLIYGVVYLVENMQL